MTLPSLSLIFWCAEEGEPLSSAYESSHFWAVLQFKSPEHSDWWNVWKEETIYNSSPNKITIYCKQIVIKVYIIIYLLFFVFKAKCFNTFNLNCTSQNSRMEEASKAGREVLNVLPGPSQRDLLNLFEPQFPHPWTSIIYVGLWWG